MIISSLQHLAVPIESVTPYPDNPRQGNIPEIRASLEQRGQYKPVLVQTSTGYVLAGNHTRYAMLDLGWEEIAVAQIDCSDAEARRIVAFDNRISDKATYDQLALAEMLKSLQHEEEGLEGTGYSDEDLDALLEDLAKGADEQMPEEGDEDPESHTATWGIIVTCRDEYHQRELLDQMESEGLTVRALTQ